MNPTSRASDPTPLTEPAPSGAGAAGSCFACGAGGMQPFWALTGIPAHSVLLMRSRQEAIDYPRGDLELGVCAACGFVQNLRFQPQVHEYSPRCEESQAFSGTFNRFARDLAVDYVARYRPKSVLEIGCGKGDFLALLCEAGNCQGVGIDPGLQPDRMRDVAGGRIRWIVDFYSERWADLTADLVLCRHTLEHIQDVRGFVSMVRRAVPRGAGAVVAFELPALERILAEGAFWDIYYEHCSYFTLGSLARLFRRCGFAVERLEKCYSDQYLLIDAPADADPQAGPPLPGEDDLPHALAQIARFREVVPRTVAAWRDWFAQTRARGDRVVLWGSGSKAVAFLSTLGLRDEVHCVTDVNPYRHGMFVPGSGHEIVPPGELRRVRPDRVVAMNPIYLAEIRADLAAMGLTPQLLALGSDPGRL